MICGLVTPDQGTVSVDGFAATDVEAKRRVGYVPQEIALYPSLSARENLGFFATMYDVARRRVRVRVDEVLELIGLTDRADDHVSSFSGGMQRRLNIGVALLHEPGLLVLDEPTVGVDPQSRHSILTTVRDLSDELGVSVLYTTHYMEEARRLCDRIAIMDEGRKIAEGTYRERVTLGDEKSRVRFSTTSRAPPGFAGELQSLPGVLTVGDVEDGYEMVVDDPGVVFPHLLARARTRVRRGDLEGHAHRARSRIGFPAAHRQGAEGLTVRTVLGGGPQRPAATGARPSAIVIAFVAPLGLTALIGMIPFGSGFHAHFVVSDQDGGVRGVRTFIDGVLGSEQAREIVTIDRVASPAVARDGRERKGGRRVRHPGWVLRCREYLRPPHRDPAGVPSRRRRDRRRVRRWLHHQLERRRTDTAGRQLGHPDQPRQTPERRQLLRARDGAVLLVLHRGDGGSQPARRTFPTHARPAARQSRVPRAVLAGKALASFMQGLVSMLVVLSASALFLGARWGDPAAVFAIVVAVTLVATSLTWVIATLAPAHRRPSGRVRLHGRDHARPRRRHLLSPYQGATAAPTRRPAHPERPHAVEALTDLSISDPSRLAGHLLALGAFALLVGGAAVARSQRLLNP